MTSAPSSALPTDRRVLLIDDDSQLLVSLRRGLSLRGFRVETCDATGTALPHLEAAWPEVVVLDVTMPGMDGITFCRLIRDRYPVPILMLTARDAIEDRVAGLNAGADDYLVKPFALDELVARINALLRRPKMFPASQAVLCFAGVVLDREAWKAARDGEDLSLTSTEFLLLEALLARPGAVCSRELLLERAWGSVEAGTSNVVDTHVANLRRKLEAGGRPRLVHTVRRAGYQLLPPE